MGLFGGSKKTYVSSVPYNLAGDEAERMNYLKTSVVGGVFSTTGASIAETLNGNYLNGPGIGLRSFARWSRNNGYNTTIGMSGGGLVSNPALDYAAIESQMSVIKGKNVILQTAEINTADYTFWGDQFMMANFPNQLESGWIVDFDEPANQIVVTLAGGGVHRFTPLNYDKAARYLYITFTPTNGSTTGPVVSGSEVVLPPGSPHPSTAGWVLTFNDTVSVGSTLTSFVHKDIFYSDGRPAETEDTSIDRSESYTAFNRIYERTVYKGIKPGTTSIWSDRQIMVQSQSATIINVVTGPDYSEEVIAGGVIKGIYTTTTRQEFELIRTYRNDTQEIIDKEWQQPEVYIYRQFSGNAVFEPMFVASADKGDFLPFIPFRIDNKFLSPSYLPDVYLASKKALKKAIRADYDDLITSISENESLGDIDYAYAVFGVALNVKDKDCKRYIYAFLLDNMFGTATKADYLSWRTQWYAAQATQTAYQAWVAAQSSSANIGYGDPEPPHIPYPVPVNSSIRVNSYNRAVMNYDIKISWAGIDEVRGNGLLKPGAKAGDLWFDSFGKEDFVQNMLVFNGDAGESWQPYLARSVTHVRLNWQETAGTWRYLDLYGLEYENKIYGGKSVIINAADALLDTDESGFIVPIHERIFKALPLTVSTQVSTACCFIVLNCYTVVKQKWYQTGIFKVFLVVVIAIISVFFPPFAATAGLLGTNIAVGISLGFAGTAALIAGAIANAIAAMILSQLIMGASTSLFGEKIGTIIGAIASFVAIQVGTAFSAGNSITSIVNDLMRADNLLKFTDVLGRGFAQYLNADAADYAKQTQEAIEQYKVQAGIIDEAMQQNMGFNQGIIDPMSLTDPVSPVFETSTGFLQRTLMTGSDIAEMSNSLITDFARITINQDLMI